MKKVFWSKIACVLVLIFSLFALTACQFLPGGDDDVIQLSTPLNLRYDNGTLKWSIVDNASGYVICVDQDEMQVQTNSFALSQLELADGEHTAKVKASGGQGFTSSAYSSSITFTYKNVNDDSGDSDDDSNQLSTPENLRYDNGTLKWSIVDNASGYVICVDQDEMQVQTNSFALSQLELADGEHTAKVKAYGGQGFTSSAYSTLITFNYENVNDDNSDSLSAITQAAFEQRYIARPTAISEKSAERYEVGGLYYTLVDMGYIDKVPLQDNVEYVHFEGVNEETVTISTSESSEESIAKKVEESISETDGWSSSVNLEAEGDFGVVKFLQSLKVKVSVGHEQNGSDTTTNTTSIENASSFTKNKSRQSTMTFVPGKNKVGYYRYILTGSVHVFAYIAYDPAVQQYVFAETYSVIDHCGWRWEYSQDGSFAYDEYGKLDLADSYLDLAKTKPAETREFIVDNIVDFKYKLLDNEDNITIKDSGYCGLKNSGRETIDLSAYSKFFTKEYVFCFDVCVNLCEVNDGIQEIYLYSKDNVATGKEIELSQARQEYGLVCGTMITHTSGKADKTPKDHYDTWYVRGDQVKDIMYITYDASGNDEDDWKRISTRIDLTICKSNIEPIYNTKFI
ncbi:MAG: hypothetical protein IJ999_05875, partial [Clostridia bacterium]|nr:hypothetical protein [Clostridia bacterium]